MTDTPQRYFIDEVENYPVYYLKPIAPGSPAGAGRVVEQALVARYEAALSEWDAVQSVLGDILEPDE